MRLNDVVRSSDTFDRRFTAEIVTLVIAAMALFALTYLFYSLDRDFLESASVIRAVVTDKNSRGVDSPKYYVSYQWVVENGHEYKGHPIDETWSGSGSWAGGEASWRALEPGVSTVEIAWRYTDDRRSTESRVLEHGFNGVPWPMLFLGITLLGVAVGRVIWRARKHQTNAAVGEPPRP